MIYSIAIINTIVLLAISGIHFYWAFGGKWGGKYAIPTREDGSSLVFKPRFFETITVAIGILGFALVILSTSNLLKINVLESYQHIFLWVISAIFLSRAIGEFRYVGFSKKVKNTLFAQYDTKYYSPLCLWLGITIALINIL